MNENSFSPAVLLDLDRFSRGLGIRLLESDRGHVRLGMTVSDAMVNGFGVCHGGAIFSLADTAFAFAASSFGDGGVALEGNISFYRTARPGDELIADARVTAESKQFAAVDVRIHLTSGADVAGFRGRFYYRRRGIRRKLGAGEHG